MRRLLVVALVVVSCASGPPTQPNDKEWSQIVSDYSWIQQVRKSQPAPPANASRKQMIEAALETQRKLEPNYQAFVDRVKEYNDRTHDPRAAKLLASEKILLGDEYMDLLSRYDKALEFYRAAVQLDPMNPEANQRVATAESRRYASLTSFSNVHTGMNEDDVRKLLGLPREDWIKQVVQNGRVYSVWIFPKSDGGASAVYFDNGVVYHTNWNAAAPPAAR